MARATGVTREAQTGHGVTGSGVTGHARSRQARGAAQTSRVTASHPETGARVSHFTGLWGWQDFTFHGLWGFVPLQGPIPAENPDRGILQQLPVHTWPHLQLHVQLVN